MKAWFFLLALSALNFIAWAAPTDDGLWKTGDAPGTILISLRQGLSRDDLRREANRLGLDENTPWVKIESALLAGVGGHVDLEVPRIGMQRVRLALSDTAHVNQAMETFRSSLLVLAAEPDHPIKAAATIVLNDPLYTGGQQWGLAATNWPQAVAAYNSGAINLVGSVMVAVLDTGVDVVNPDLAGQVLSGASFVSNEPTTDDLNGHGTFCAALIAAVTGNSQGIAGAFFEPGKIKILPVKVLNSNGSGNTSDFAAGVAYALGQGARVINLSIQSPQGSQAMESAIDDARRNGVMVVVAAGNNSGGTSYPAVYAQAFSVGSLNHDNTKASYSNVGKIELSAPGGDNASSCPCVSLPVSGCPFEIWSRAANTPGCPYSNRFEAGAGTSFAAPLVAAAAALLFSQDPDRQVEDVQRILLQTASATALGVGYNSQTGWGKLNFYGALTYQSSLQTGSNIKAYNWPNPFNPDKDALTTLTFFLPTAAATTLRLIDAGGDLVRRWDLDLTQSHTGMNLVTWDGRNGLGAAVANGSYTLVVQSAGARATAVVAVLR